MPMAGTLAPKTAFTFRVRAKRVIEILEREVGPEHRRRPQLCVGYLPQQEFRDAQLSASADEQIGVGVPWRVEARRDGRLIDGVRCDAVSDDATYRVDDLGPT